MSKEFFSAEHKAPPGSWARTLTEDAQHMEDAACHVADRCDIWQDRIIYWLSVAVLHILQYLLRHEAKRTRRSMTGKELEEANFEL